MADEKKKERKRICTGRKKREEKEYGPSKKILKIYFQFYNLQFLLLSFFSGLKSVIGVCI